MVFCLHLSTRFARFFAYTHAMHLSPTRSPNKQQNNKTVKVEWERVSLLSAVPKKRRGQTLVAYKNKLYLYGGYYGSHAGDLWVFSPGNYNR